MAFLIKKVSPSPHRVQNSHAYRRLPSGRPDADVTTNACDATENKNGKVNFTHEGSPATFHHFRDSKLEKKQNKFTFSFKQLHILLIIIKYLSDFHWYNSSILSIIFSFSSSCIHPSHQSPPPALHRHPPPPHHHRYQPQSCPAAAPVAAILFPQVS